MDLSTEELAKIIDDALAGGQADGMGVAQALQDAGVSFSRGNGEPEGEESDLMGGGEESNLPMGESAKPFPLDEAENRAASIAFEKFGPKKEKKGEGKGNPFGKDGGNKEKKEKKEKPPKKGAPSPLWK